MESAISCPAPFITVGQVYEAFGGVVSLSTLCRHLQNGVIPSFRLGARRYVPVSWLEEALKIGAP
jgi:hypothetical protein